MKHPARFLLLVLATAVFFPRTASATLTFTQLDDDVFTVSHRVKIIGSRGKATKMVYTKAASLCMAAGYTHFKILDQESQAAQEYESANASIRVKFYLVDGEDRMECEHTADPEYIQEAAEKLVKKGYTPPSRIAAMAQMEAEGAPAAEAAGICAEGCTVEQIAAMARAGLSDEQIRAACSGSG